MRKNLVAVITLISCLAGWCFASCSQKGEPSEEQITVGTVSGISTAEDTSLNSVTKDLTMKEVPTFPNKVILTGLDEHRLVSIYKSKPPETRGGADNSNRTYSYNEGEDEQNEHFMPGVDILFGYNLLNIAHYDLKTEKTNLLFNHPVLVKTLYYPSFVQDTLNKQPINRDYYLVSVYDEDTNKDNLINKKDLRRFYHFDAHCATKTQLIPGNYAVTRSQYDSKNDLMYIFARYDENRNGTEEKSEPIQIFWFSLRTPAKAKFLYRNIN